MIHARLNGMSLLKERNFRLFFIGQSTSLLGDGMISVALAFAVLDLTRSPADLGFVLAARSVAMVATLLIGGVIADRLPRRSVMITADVARLLSQGTMASLLITGHAWILVLAALQVVHGTAAALFTPSSVGLIPTIVSGDHLQHANALRGLMSSFGNTVGPALAGVLVAVTSPGWAIAFDAATFAVSAAALTYLRPPPHSPPAPQSFLHDLLSGWAEFRSRSWVWAIVVLSAFTNMLFAAFVVLGPAVAKTSFGGATAWATILTAFGLGSVLGGLVAFRIHPGRPLRTSVLAVAFLPLPTLGLAAHLPAFAVAGLALLGGIGATLFNALWETTLQRRIPNESLSRVSAYDWFASFGCQPIGQATAGPAAAAIGIHPCLWAAGATQLLVTIATLAVPTIRHMPAAENTDREAETSTYKDTKRPA